MSGLTGGQVLNGRQQFINGNGRPLAGGQVTFYLPATTTPVVTYQDPDYTTPNSNPVVLDAAGMATIYYNDQVRQVVRDREGNLIWDRITGSSANLATATVNVLNIAALRLNTVPFPVLYVRGYRATGDGGEGLFYWVSADTTSPDDGGSIIIDASGRRYYRDVDRGRGEVNVRWWGAYGDAVTNDAVAVQRCFTYAAFQAMIAYVPEGTFYTASALTLAGGAKGFKMDGQLLSEGGFVALTLGDGGLSRNWNKLYGPIRVKRRLTSDWSSEGDVGVRIYNCDACIVDVEQAEGFTIGVQTFGDGRGFEDSNVFLNRIVDNRYGLDVRTGQATGWNNSIRYFGGHFACSSGTNTTTPRYGVRFSAAPGAYDRHNAHAFYGPGFELQRQGTPGTVEAIPFLLTAGDERGIMADRVRMEACSQYVARVTLGVNDCSFWVTYTGTYGFTGNQVLYDGGVTRSGVTVYPNHQAGAALGTPRLFADAASVRSMAYRDNSQSATGVADQGAIGFEKMVTLSGAPNSAIVNLSNGVFNGLTFASGGVSLLKGDYLELTTARALAFVVDVERCKEVFIAAEGQYMRLIVQQYDASENILNESYPIMISNMNSVPNFTNPIPTPPFAPMWWEGNVDLDEPLTLPGQVVPDFNRMQRVRVNALTRYAVIGVRGGQAGAILRSLRLYCDALQAPPLVYGGARSWGMQERSVFLNGYDPPSLTPGSRAFQVVTFPNARTGDDLSATFAPDTVGTSDIGHIRITAAVRSANSVNVCLENIHPTNTIDLGVGTLYVQARKIRL